MTLNDDCVTSSVKPSSSDGGGDACIHCGFIQKSTRIFVEGNKDIRLNRCENCHELIDKYVEYELITIIFDLLLLKTKAFIHILFNYINRSGILNVIIN